MTPSHEWQLEIALRFYLLACLAVLLSSICAGAGADAVPPAAFVFGDSLVDAGNNNYLVTLSRANYPPNGIDFDGHQPTGRYTNGRTIVDILGDRKDTLVSYLNFTVTMPLCFIMDSDVSGQELGLGGFVPPYLDPNTTGDVLFRGVNYASGGGGILNQTGSIFVSILNCSLSFSVLLFHQPVIS
jgi:hypothetical protein